MRRYFLKVFPFYNKNNLAYAFRGNMPGKAFARFVAERGIDNDQIEVSAKDQTSRFRAGLQGDNVTDGSGV
jgi:hypothetical protein